MQPSRFGNWLSLVVQAIIPITEEVESWGSQIQNQSETQKEFKSFLGKIVRS